MKKTLQITNGIALIVTIFINYISNTGALNGKTVGEISDKYHTLLTPAAYAFSIWGLIYLMLLAFVIYQGLGLFKKIEDNDFILQIGWWFVISCVANSLWIITWIYEYTGLSVLIILILLFSLLKIVINTNMERWGAPVPKIVFFWWPFCVYCGWVTIATIVNISAYLTKVGWSGWGLQDESWSIIMIIAAGLINLAIIWTRNMREFAAAGIWAVVAVAVANWNMNPPIVWTALVTSAILFIAIGIHGFKNRAALT